MYRLLLSAVVNAKKYGFLKEDELAKIETPMRKDTTLCGASNLFYLSILYSANNSLPRARLIALTAIDLQLNPVFGQRNTSSLGQYYALILMIDLAQQKGGTATEQANRVWDTLKILTNKEAVPYSELSGYFQHPNLIPLKDFFALR